MQPSWFESEFGFERGTLCSSTCCPDRTLGPADFGRSSLINSKLPSYFKAFLGFQGEQDGSPARHYILRCFLTLHFITFKHRMSPFWTSDHVLPRASKAAC